LIVADGEPEPEVGAVTLVVVVVITVGEAPAGLDTVAVGV